MVLRRMLRLNAAIYFTYFLIFKENLRLIFLFLLLHFVLLFQWHFPCTPKNKSKYMLPISAYMKRESKINTEDT